MKNFYLLLVISIFSNIAFAQKNPDSLDAKFRSLGYTRGIYLYYKNLAESNKFNSQLQDKRDSVGKVYFEMIANVKAYSKSYLKQVNLALEKNLLDDLQQIYPYSWSPKITSENPKSQLVTQLDLYRIIKYYLLERKLRCLPDLERIPFYDKKRLKIEPVLFDIDQKKLNSSENTNSN